MFILVRTVIALIILATLQTGRRQYHHLQLVVFFITLWDSHFPPCSPQSLQHWSTTAMLPLNIAALLAVIILAVPLLVWASMGGPLFPKLVPIIPTPVLQLQTLTTHFSRVSGPWTRHLKYYVLQNGIIHDNYYHLNIGNSGSSGDEEEDYLGRKKPKRGVLPKHATSIMRSWLFAHIVVITK